MDDYGVVPETGTVRFERVLPGPIERVWAYLTESEKRGTWLASGPMDLRVGGRVDLRFRRADAGALPERPRRGPRLWPHHALRPAPPAELHLARRGGSRLGGHVRADLARRGRAPRADPPPPRQSGGDGERRRRLAHPPRSPRRPSQRPGPTPVLGDARPRRGPVRQAAAGRPTRWTGGRETPIGPMREEP